MNLSRAKRYLRNRNLHKKFKTGDELVSWHFKSIGEPEHMCREGIAKAISLLGDAPARILETGSSAWGTDSTRLWARYINNFGGELDSVDIREAPRSELGNLGPRARLHIGDSVNWISNQTGKPSTYDLVYLDSWDVDWNDSRDSALHGLKEFESAKRFFTIGTLILIDDTPRDKGLIPSKFHFSAEKFLQEFDVLPGKGAFILKTLPLEKFEVLHHGYNVLLRVVKI
jgi:hypothetical protein